MLAAPPLAAEITNISVVPVPDWVRLDSWSMPTNHSNGDKSEDFRYLLHEVQLHPREKQKFIRVVRLMENQEGVQDSGSLTFSFDPDYQDLLLHHVQIHRAGKALQRLDRSRIKIIQPEPELGGHVFTGEHSAVLFLEDLRIGDVLEYAYTIRGANPVLKGHFSTRFFVQGNRPFDRERLRLIWPQGKTISLRQHLCDLSPRKLTCAEGEEYLWDFTNLDGIHAEDALPISYEPYPYIEFCDFEDWSKVLEWGLPLYSNSPSNLSVDVSDLISKWRNSPNSQEEKARAALEFVQDEIRYTGIELGPDSYRPTQPSDTLRTRYGDCKAKAVLLCSLLHELGIQAYPALVNTLDREAVADRLPSPFAFNHVIAKVLLEGKSIWVDPTRTHQGGQLWDRYTPPLRKALVLKAGVAVLEDIPVCSGGLQRVSSTFDIKDYKSPVCFTVKTVYEGLEADDIRGYLAGTEAKKVAKNYLNFYARYYPAVRQLRPPEVDDHRTPNRLTMSEFYEITNLWEVDKASSALEATVYAESLETMLTDPNTRLRKMPLEIAWPCRREQRIIVNLPESDWDITPLDESVEGNAFVFHYRRRFSGSTVSFDYDCQTKAPEIAAERVPEYLKKREQMQNLLTDTLSRPEEGARATLRRINWAMVAVAGFGSGAFFAAGFWFWRRTATPANTPGTLESYPVDPRLQGLSGWLLLVGVGICAGLVWKAVFFIRSCRSFFSTVVWQAVALPGGEHYHPLFAPLLIFEVLSNLALIALNILAVCLFFTRRKPFPRTYIAMLLASLLIVLGDHLVARTIPYLAEDSTGEFPRDLFRAVFQAALWCSYMLVSRRVKATFVR
ncbi:MAG: hypothetical protein C5B50_06205 [Verrucomicrobia bacterium]|nr:MAG: hypothetical protein C5B50_06205 [Verrucomicrobiota bacterium]